MNTPNTTKQLARPMTSVRAAGYSSTVKTPSSPFDPFNMALKIDKNDPIKLAEKKVSNLINESVLFGSQGNWQSALETAKESAKHERQILKLRDTTTSEPPPQPNLDLSYCVLINLATCFHALKMYPEALAQYAAISKNKSFNQSGRLRVNMGNIYFEQGKYTSAIKMYRMALDQIGNHNNDIRLKIMRNVGVSFIKMGQYQEAITSFESIAEGNRDSRAGDRERMKKGFTRLLATRSIILDSSFDSSKTDLDDNDIFNQDSLREISKQRQLEIERYILMSAKLILQNSLENDGYDWIIDSIKSSQYTNIASELEIFKAIVYLSNKEFQKAIDSLKSFEKKDVKGVTTASTNLSFLYLLENDIKNAEKYAKLAVDSNRYNAKAQTNLGNCMYYKQDFVKSIEYYLEAVGVDANCVESMYNLGLVNKELKKFEEALVWFEKLHNILRNSSDVIYQIADIHDIMGNVSIAMEWFNVLISIVPTDPGVLARIGELFVKLNDPTQAFHSYSESYRYFPSSLNVISWLGSYYVDCEIYDQAIQFFERAAMLQPQDSKWPLLIASCYRKNGNYQTAFECYKFVNEKFPDNAVCLKFLVRICTDLGIKDLAAEYSVKLEKLNTGVSNGLTGVEYSFDKVDTTPSHATRNISSKKNLVADEDWNEDVQELLPF